MADILCGYTADRDETLVAYLYNDIEPSQRAAFEAHIATCERCRYELEELQDVRGQLQHWIAPDVPHTVEVRTAAVGAVPRTGPLHWLPVWAQVAAALLFLGVSAGVAGAIANLDIRYGALTLRTGWSRSAPGDAVPALNASQPPAAGSGARIDPWQRDLDALERRLRADLPAAALGAHVEGSAPNADAQLLRKVRTLVDESERRQRNELALRIAEVVQEF